MTDPAPDLDELAEELDNPAPEASPEATPEQPAKKAVHKVPWDYSNHPWAKAINAKVGKLLGKAREDPELPAEVLLGEATTQTIEEQAGIASMPGHYWLALSLLAMAALIALRRLDAPQDTAGPVPREPKPSQATQELPGEYAGAEIRPAA